MTSRNSVGTSSQSVALPIRAAKIPDAPINLSIDKDITTAYQIGLKWSESTNGSIFSFKLVLIKELK